MPTQRRQRFINAQLAWMLVTIVLLAAADALTLQSFFLFSLVGLLIVTDLTSPMNVTPKWRKRLRVVVLLGLVAFGLVVGGWVFEQIYAVLSD